MADVDQYISITKAKAQLLEIVRRVQKQPETVAITREGIPAAVLLSMDHFEGLIETLEILSDQKTMRSLRRSMKQAQAANWVTSHGVFEDKGA